MTEQEEGELKEGRTARQKDKDRKTERQKDRRKKRDLKEKNYGMNYNII